MSKDQSAGVATLGLILSRMATGEPLSVGALVADGGVARSTAFAVVKRMVEAGLVSKQPDGHLVPGTVAGAFAYAASNLAPLHGRAGPILTWLRDQTNAGVELQACQGATYQTLARFSASPGTEMSRGTLMLFTVRRGGKEAAILRMVHTEASIDEASCRTLAAEAVSRLEQMLADEQA